MQLNSQGRRNVTVPQLISFFLHCTLWSQLHLWYLHISMYRISSVWRVLYTHNTLQTGQYLLFCVSLYQNCETREALLYQNSLVWYSYGHAQMHACMHAHICCMHMRAHTHTHTYTHRAHQWLLWQ